MEKETEQRFEKLKLKLKLKLRLKLKVMLMVKLKLKLIDLREYIIIIIIRFNTPVRMNCVFVSVLAMRSRILFFL